MYGFPPPPPLIDTERDAVLAFAPDQQTRDYLKTILTIANTAPPGAAIAYGDYYSEKFGYDAYPECNGGGFCVAWVEYVMNKIPVGPANVNVVEVDWMYEGPILIYTGHTAIRVEVGQPSGAMLIFYLDNFVIGGFNHIFFPSDVDPTAYTNEHPMLPQSFVTVESSGNSGTPSTFRSTP